MEIEPPDMEPTHIIWTDEGITYIKRYRSIVDRILFIQGIEILRNPFKESDEDE